jgi:hypothetical protein
MKRPYSLEALDFKIGLEAGVIQALLHNPSRAHDFAQFLEYLWVSHGYDVPEDMDFIAGTADEFQLAAIGQYGTIEDCTKEMIEHLSKFSEAPNGVVN